MKSLILIDWQPDAQLNQHKIVTAKVCLLMAIYICLAFVSVYKSCSGANQRCLATRYSPSAFAEPEHVRKAKQKHLHMKCSWSDFKMQLSSFMANSTQSALILKNIWFLSAWQQMRQSCRNATRNENSAGNKFYIFTDAAFSLLKFNPNQRFLCLSSSNVSSLPVYWNFMQFLHFIENACTLLTWLETCGPLVARGYATRLKFVFDTLWVFVAKLSKGLRTTSNRNCKLSKIKVWKLLSMLRSFVAFVGH